MSAGTSQWMGQVQLRLVTALFEPQESWRLPPSPEVTMRGALGKALLEVVCVREHQRCEGCDLVQSCLFPTWFDPGRSGSAGPRPFALSVFPPGGHWVSAHEPLRVELVLLTDPPRHTLLVEALERAALQGLGPHRVRHELARLVVHGEGAPVVLVADDLGVGRWPEATTLARLARLPQQPAGARLHLLTPLQLSRRMGRRRPQARHVLMSAIQRIKAVATAQGEHLVRRWDLVEGRWLDLRWVEASRWSKRQEHAVDLSGWRGVLELGPEVAEVADLLAAVEVLQMGRGTSAGCGRVAVEWID